MNIPNWVSDLVIKVLEEHNCNDIPNLTWRRYNSYSSSGTAYYDKEKGIVIRAGKKAKRWEQKLVLLHELAHWLRPNKEPHSPDFWKLAFQLYKENKIPIRKALDREKSYKKGAENGYRIVRGLKPKKVSHKRKEISRLDKLPKYNVIGIRKDENNRAWAVTYIGTPGYFDRWGRSTTGRWRGYKISDELYKKLLKQGYKVV